MKRKGSCSSTSSRLFCGGCQKSDWILSRCFHTCGYIVLSKRIGNPRMIVLARAKTDHPHLVVVDKSFALNRLPMAALTM